MTHIRGIRGATTSHANTKESILGATRELLGELISTNHIRSDDVAAAFFTTTEDLNAEFPAQAARQIGWNYVALLDGHEMKVPDATAKCIRVLILMNTDKGPDELNHVYLRGASNLRARGVGGADILGNTCD